MIEDVIIELLKVFADERGKVMHMLRCDDPFFKKFGEIYFSVINKGIIKGWKKHFKMTQHFVVPVGEIKLVLYDDRETSKTSGEIQEIYLGVNNYVLVRIPPLVCYSFKAVNEEFAMIANCSDIPHDPKETVVFPLQYNSIPYSWEQS